MANDFTFKTSAIRSVVATPITDIATDQVDNIVSTPSDYLNVLSKKSGIDIKNDCDLAKAKTTIVENLNATIQQATGSLTSPLSSLNEVVSDQLDKVKDLVPDGLTDTLESALSSAKEYKSYFDIASGLCEGMSFNGMNVDLLKGMYDFNGILSHVFEMKDFDFLSQLSECSFFDLDCIDQTLGQVDDIISLGDVDMFDTITDIVGVPKMEGVRNIVDDVTNIAKQTKDFAKLDTVMGKFGLDKLDIVNDVTQNIPSLPAVKDIANVNTDLAKHILGDNKYKIASSVATHLGF